MQTLNSIATGVHTIIYPSQNDESSIDVSVFVSAAKTHYAFRTLYKYLENKNQNGESEIPSSLLTFGTVIVKEKIADISNLNAMRSLPSEVWIQSLGGFECGDCTYDIMDMNKWKLLCNDKSRKEGDKAVIVVGNSLRFPEGTFEDNDEIEIIYANNGSGIEENTQIDESLGALIRSDLLKEFSKRFPLDKTNNSNGDT